MAWIESGDLTAVGDLGFGDTCCSSLLVLSSRSIFHSPHLSRAVCAGAVHQWRRASVCGGFTMMGVYFKTRTSEPVGLLCTPDGKIDMSDLGRKFGLDPISIELNGFPCPKEGLKSSNSWEQMKAFFEQGGVPLGGKEDPVMVGGVPAVSTDSATLGVAPTSFQIFRSGGSPERGDWLKAFSAVYKDERSCVKTFTNFVDTCAVGWDRALYLAPYTSLVQSSGTGKSRLLKEFANDRYVIYCCVRARGSSGIPARSWIADKLLPPPSIENQEVERLDGSVLYASFICACIDHLAHSIETTKITAKEWCQKQLEESASGGTDVSGVDFWKEIYKRMTTFKDKCPSKEEVVVMKHLESEIRETCEKFLKICKCSEVVTEDRALLTFAMDEASNLLGAYGGTTYFSIFRWMASFLRKGCGIFIVLLDTASEVSNFMPSSIRDGSYRYSSKSRELLPPFYTVNTFNILAPEEKIWDHLTNLPDKVDLTPQLTSHFKKGRPLFGSYIQSASNDQVEEVVRLAVAKLLGGVGVPKSLEVNKEQAVALLSIRAAVFVKPQSELASSLVAHHLGMCVAISSDRRSVFTLYPSEPALAEAACRIMNRDSELNLGEILDPILPWIREGIVEGGARGELVARLLLLLAWDHACRENMLDYGPRFPIFRDHKVLYTRPLTVRQFLNSLVDEGLLDAALKSQIDEPAKERFLAGRVLFTHFTSVTYHVKRSALLDFYESSAAVVCKRGEKGSDLIIPVWLCQGDMSCILVQVRNYSGADSKYKWASLDVTLEGARLEQEQADYPYLALYLLLGYETPKVYNLKYGKHGDAVPSAIPPAKRQTEPTDEPTSKTGKKRGRSIENSLEDPFQMIVGLFSLKPEIYPFLRDEGHKGDGHSKSSEHLSALATAWTDPLQYVQSNKSKGLGEGPEMNEEKCSFVRKTGFLAYGSGS